MFKNYFKTAFRSLLKNRLYTTLNITGLCFGISCFLLIGLYLFDELSYDRQHGKSDRIYRLVEHKTVNGESTTIAAGSFKLAEESPRKIAGVENTTRIRRTGRANLVNPENPLNLFQETVTVGDNQLLEIFDFPLLYGDKKTALKDPFSIIIDETLAKRLFSRTDVLGKTLQFSFMNEPLKVTGVLKNHVSNSTLNFSSVMSDASYKNSDFYKRLEASDWLSETFTVYALLKPTATPAVVAQQMTGLVKDNITTESGTSFSFSLQPLKDIHLYSENIQDGARNSNVDAIPAGNPRYIKIFFFISLFVLLIAGINYMNLTTAKASGRFKEIGVRKAIGALKSNLIRQFLLESFLITIISFLLALLVVNLVLPAFNSFSGKDLSLGFKTDYRIWLLAILFTMVFGFMSGGYPAFILSRFQPVSLLKNSTVQNKNGLSLRKGLVIFQFTISVIMIVATLVLYLQVRYLNTSDLGFNKDQLVVIDVNTGKARANATAVKTAMERIPTVKNVSVTSRVPGEWKTFRMLKVRNSGNTREPDIAYMFGVDEDFLKTFQISLLSGRNFNSRNDSTVVVVNETAARLLGIKEPANQLVEIPAFAEGSTFGSLDIPFTPRVVGIVKDFHFQSLRDKIEPLILAYKYNPIQLLDYYTVRISATNISETLDKLKKVMVDNDKNDPFEYHFLDGQLALFYIEDGRRQAILIFAALATIFIACLGLFGLATYSAEQRVKEIGVRKILGASVFNLATLLSKDFLKLVLIANGIAFPIAWWATNKWLQEYAYHIDMQWWFLVLAGILAIGIALITVSYQAIRAAKANPVTSLRSE